MLCQNTKAAKECYDMLMQDSSDPPSSLIADFQNEIAEDSTNRQGEVLGGHGEAEAHVRALLLRDLAGVLHIRDLESTNIEDTNRVQVSATVRADTRQDRVLEQIIGRLSLEPLVTSARWRLELGE